MPAKKKATQVSGPQALHKYLSNFNLLSNEELDEFVNAFSQSTVSKRQYIVQPGFTARYRHFVVKGAFRSFVICDSGSDHTISFAIENWWITDYNSFIYQQPATMFVMALEDSTIMRIDFETEQMLKAKNKNFETIFRTMAERGLAFWQRQIISNLTQTATARYNLFISKYPDVAQRLPQYALASFLGMTTEFLSKIRNRKLKKKS